MPTRSMLTSVGLIVLLAIGLAVVYLPQLSAAVGAPQRLPTTDELVYITDLDFWQRTPRERAVVANAYFDLNHDLNNVPLVVGAWEGVDVPETNQEVLILLEPEQYIQRLYNDDTGRYLWLSMVGGRSSQPFHAPDICYDADGWQYDLGSHATPLNGGGEIYGLWLHAKKQLSDYSEPAEHVVYYFYLFPDARRHQADGIVLFKLTSGRYGTLEETLAMHEAFVRSFFGKAGAPAELALAPAP
ncbi:MAG: exosortase-associated EpsI family protein [Caldilinea sp.]